MRLLSFDLETAGVKREYALQPWRVREQKAWISTAAFAFQRATDPSPWVSQGHIYPTQEQLGAPLRAARDHDFRVVGWNVTFDIAWLIAYGLEDLVFQCKWLDGMRAWRHYFIEPEYEFDRSHKKAYKLKPDAVQECCPELTGYEEDIDYQTHDPVLLKKLLNYNEIDTIAAGRSTLYFWKLLTPEQQQCALIEADCLPHVALANLRGMLVDLDRLHDLDSEYKAKADHLAQELLADGVTAEIVRSPLQLSKLLFETWGLPMIGSKGKRDSTDKTVLHELSFLDPRAKKIREFREALNLRSKFINSIAKSCAYNAR